MRSPGESVPGGDDSGPRSGPRPRTTSAEEGPIRIRALLGASIERAASLSSHDRAVDAERAAELWRTFVCGGWALLERADAPGTRLVLARAADPDDPRGAALTGEERRVLLLSCRGVSAKCIAYELGVSPSTAWFRRQRALEKLGLGSLEELARLAGTPECERAAIDDRTAPIPVPLDLSALTWCCGGLDLVLFAIPLPELEPPCELSPAEREVVRRVIAGRSNRDIARERGTSPRTVANQLQSVFRKLAVSGRAALIRRCTERRAARTV